MHNLLRIMDLAGFSRNRFECLDLEPLLDISQVAQWHNLRIDLILLRYLDPYSIVTQI